MSILARFTNTSPTTTEQYDDAVKHLQDVGDFPPDGMEHHVCALSRTGTSGSARSANRASNSTHSQSASCLFSRRWA
jgi:hypothetical protein